MQDCKNCNGTGRCLTCKGSGHFCYPRYGSVGNRPQCGVCQGSGTCRVCKGSGKDSLTRYAR
jgi:hypothetical protein